MKFEPLYYGDRVKIINDEGDVGVCCLWTPIKTAISILERNNIDLSSNSRIAVIGNLYGDGAPHMNRNLTWNPQIKYILVFGQNLSNSAEKIIHGNITNLGVSKFDDKLKEYFNTLPIIEECNTERYAEPIEEYKQEYLPSNIYNHNILRENPLDAWEEVVFRLMKFGIPTVASKVKNRYELQNLKVVISNPVEDNEKDLVQYGYTLEEFHQYQEDILNPILPDDILYTYGNRLRGWKNIDSIVEVINKLKADNTTRGAYISIWDTQRDLASDSKGHPCLVSLFFRVIEDRLTLTATFRSHNALTAWLKNVYGLIAIQRYVSKNINIQVGSITVISHSITVDPNALERIEVARKIVDSKTTDNVIDRSNGKQTLREDPCGYFSIYVKDGYIIVEHKTNGNIINTYRGKSAIELEHQLARDNIISLISHAMYVGRELYRNESLLKS